VKRLILFGSLAAILIAAPASAWRFSFFDVFPTTCEGPPYPSSPFEVGINMNSLGGLKQMAALEVSLNGAMPPTLPLRMVCRNAGGAEFASESFFDVFYEGAQEDFSAQSFFDVFFRLFSGPKPLAIVGIEPSLGLADDGGFDLFCRIEFENQATGRLHVKGKILGGLVLRGARLGEFVRGDSFFDVFVDLDNPGIAAVDFNEPVLTMSMTGSYEPPSLAALSLYETPDRTGAASDYRIYYDLCTPPDTNAFYYESGYSVPSGHYALDGPLPAAGPGGHRIEQVAALFPEGKIIILQGRYNEQGRVVRIEQVNKDANEPNDVLTFEYDAAQRLTAVELYKAQPTAKKKKKVELAGYCQNCPVPLRKIPQKCTYRDLEDPNKDVEVWATYDVRGNLTGIGKRVHCPLGEQSFISLAYDPNGRIVSACRNRDDDCDGYYETPVVAASLRYDSAGRLVSIYDVVSDSNILEWERTNITGTELQEQIRIRSIFGDPNLSVFSDTTTDASDSNTYSGQAEITVPDTGGSVQIRNWNWLGEAGGVANPVSADVNWTALNPNVGDVVIGNRVILPILRPDGELAGTLDAREFSVCGYSGQSRKKGSVVARDGSVAKVLHFYEWDFDYDGAVDPPEDKRVTAMLTINEYGRCIVGIAGGADELARWNFFEAWPCRWEGPNLDRLRPPGWITARFNFFEAWPSYAGPFFEAWPTSDGGPGTRDAWNWRNDPARFHFFEAWPSSWGPQPYIPIYSETGDGTRYIAGAVTPGGAYCYFQYGQDGQIEAIVRLNSVDAVGCAEELPGDLDGNCKLDFGDFGMMAARWLQCALEYEPACQ